MSLLLIKIFVTPLMVLAASLTGRRWGEAAGGWLVRSVAPPRWDLPVRIIVVTTFVVALTSLASTLGARASGAIASFPLIGAALAVFAQRAQGAAAGVDALRGMAMALFAFAMFFYVLSLLLARSGLALAFCGAAISALLVQGVTLKTLRRRVVQAPG